MFLLSMSDFQLIYKHKISKQISKSLNESFQVVQNKRAAMRAKKAKVILEENAAQAVLSELSVYPLAQVEQVAPLAAGQVAQLVIVEEQEVQVDASTR